MTYGGLGASSAAAAAAAAALLLLLLSWPGAAAGQEEGAPSPNATCKDASHQVVPFMRTPVPADDLDALLGPLWWVMEGNPFRSYDMSGLKPQAAEYLKTYAMQPIAGVGAVYCLAVLSLLAFLLWRLVRCVCVVCCQQEAYSDPGKVLSSRRLRVWKGLTVVLGLAGAGMAAWGMVSLQRSFPLAVSSQVDALQELPERLVGAVRGLAAGARNLTAPLDAFAAIIQEVNVTGMRADVAAIDDFFANAPTPAQLRASVAALESALTGGLAGALGALKAEIDGGAGSGLKQLEAHIDELQGLSVAAMATGVGSYDDAVQAMAGLAGTPTSAAPEFAVLVSEQAAVSGASGLPAWLQSLASAKASAQAILATCGSPTNPFAVVQACLAAVNAAAADVTGAKLADLSGKVRAFNGLWHNNASLAFEGLLAKATHANSSVMVLPDEAQAQVNSLRGSLADIQAMYAAGPRSLLTLPDEIDAMSQGVTLPDTAPLDASLAGTKATLDAAAPDLAQLIQHLDNLTAVLTGLQQPVANIGQAAASFQAGSSDWNALRGTLAAEGPAVAVAAHVLAAVDLGPFISSSAGQIKAGMSGSAPQMAQQAAAVGDAQQAVADFDLGPLDASLQQAAAAYAAFGGDPSTLTRPVISLLDEISSLTTTQLASARSMVHDVADTVGGVADKVQLLAIDKVDSFQARLINGTAEGRKGKAVQLYNYAYDGLMGAYGLVLLLLLLLFAAALRNCPAGVCSLGFLLNLALVLFGLLPVLYTVVMLLMRDTCANAESLALRAVDARGGGGAGGAGGASGVLGAVAHFYLGGGGAPPAGGGQAASVADVLAGINPDFDVAAVKAQVNHTVEAMRQEIAARFVLQPPVERVLDQLTGQVSGLMGGVDGVVELLDYPSVSQAYFELKGWLCCDLADRLFEQWAACLALLTLAWAALQCAFAVLRNLDGLSDHCCAASCYSPGDYQAAATPPQCERLESADGGDMTVAVISIGGVQQGKGKGKAQALSESTPMPPPLHVMSSAPSAPMLSSPPMYPPIAAPPAAAPPALQPAEASYLAAQRLSLLGPQAAAVPTMAGGGAYAPGGLQHGWGRTSPAPSGAMLPPQGGYPHPQGGSGYPYM